MGTIEEQAKNQTESMTDKVRQTPKIDLTEYNTPEAFAAQLQRMFSQLDAANISSETLISIIEDATQNWPKFNLENYGIILPKAVESKDSSGLTAEVSPRDLFIATAVFTLWYDMLKETVDSILPQQDALGHYLKKDVSPESMQRLKIVEDIALPLMPKRILPDVFIEDIQNTYASMIKITQQTYFAEKNLAAHDKAVLTTLLFSKKYLNNDQIQVLVTAPDRTKKLIEAIGQTLFSDDYRMHLDHFMYGSEKIKSPKDTPINITPYKGNLQWEDKLADFIAKVQVYYKTEIPEEENTKV